jgi:AcrR family transcriptional regulator
MPSREEKKAATRKKLLAAAAAVVAKQGAMAASLDAIAEKAGMTKGAVYSNFDSKSALLEALSEMAGPNIDLENDFDPDLSLAENFERFGRIAARELASVSSRAWNLGLELTHYAIRDPATRRRYAAAQRSGREEAGRQFAGWFEATGSHPSLEPEELHVVMNALAVGLAQQRAIDPPSVPDDLFAKAFRLLAS